jgi:hypothetical protein
MTGASFERERLSAGSRSVIRGILAISTHRIKQMAQSVSSWPLSVKNLTCLFDEDMPSLPIFCHLPEKVGDGILVPGYISDILLKIAEESQVLPYPKISILRIAALSALL